MASFMSLVVVFDVMSVINVDADVKMLNDKTCEVREDPTTYNPIEFDCKFQGAGLDGFDGRNTVEKLSMDRLKPLPFLNIPQGIGLHMVELKEGSCDHIKAAVNVDIWVAWEPCEHLNNISNDDLKRMVMRIYHRQPSNILDIIDVRDAGNGSPEISPNNEIEKVCCKQTPVNCHSQLREFNTVVLDELVLEVARRMREDLMIDPHDDSFNRGNRHAAYRQYVLWIHGYLGAGNRRVIPSCVVWKIREKYPDPVGQYVGFEPGRLG